MDTQEKLPAMLDWCAKIQYPNLKPLVAGTIFIEANAPMHEVEAAFKKKFTEFIPDTYEIKELIRGSIWFGPTKEDV